MKALEMNRKKALVFRLSSLGDLILATAFLENLDPSFQVTWVTSKDFAEVIRLHPRVSEVIEFDKKAGLSGWWQLIRSLDQHQFDLWVDLHATIRTRLVRLWYFRKKWVWISKPRLRFAINLVLKQWTPERFRMPPWWTVFAKLGQQVSSEKTNPLRPPRLECLPSSDRPKQNSGPYWVIMPASRWKSKEWPVQQFVEWIKIQTKHQNPKKFVIVGRSSDRACRELTHALQQEKIPFESAMDTKPFAELAKIVAGAEAYLGGDTGLAHLAEALGVPAMMIFGPTRPQLGFGPWQPTSRAIHTDVFCSPCGKDGRRCFRLDRPYACMTDLTPELVDGIVKKVNST